MPAGNKNYMSIGVLVRTTRFAARNNGIGVRQESNPQSPTAYSSVRWEKSPFGAIFPNDRPAPPTVGKPSLHSHDAFPTAALDAFRIGAKKLLPETTTKPGGH